MYVDLSLMKDSASKLLLSALPQRIQCSKEKKGNYKLSIPKFIAIDEYNFIQFSHPDYYKFISIDIDSREEFKSHKDIEIVCNVNSIPLPTFIVKTSKGWHLHWALEEPIWKNNKKLMLFRKRLLLKLNKFFGGDKNSAGFIMRNPLLHESWYNNTIYTYKDFKSIVDYEEIVKEIYEKEQTKAFINERMVKADPKTTQVGSRNKVLVENLRTILFRNYKKITKIPIPEDYVLEVARGINSQFPEPQEEKEVDSVALCVLEFVKKNYDPIIANKASKEYNQKLAKRKARKAKRQIIKNILNRIVDKTINPYLLLFNKYSKSGLAKLVSVDKKTLSKYWDNLIKAIKEVIDRIKAIMGKESTLQEVLNMVDSFIVGKWFSFSLVKENYDYYLKLRKQKLAFNTS